MNVLSAIGKVFAKAPGYAVVRDRDAGRDSVSIETKTEDELLKGRKRLQMIATHRESFRNSTFSPASALQLKINCIGTVGGRLTVMGSDGTIDEEATRQFKRWARHAEFTRGTSLNELLGMILAQLTHTGGDFIAVFDRGQLTHADSPSLRVKIFESDQIKNIEDGEFQKLYPPAADGTPNYYQVDGIVVDKWDRVVSAFVGNSRKSQTFGKGEYIVLKPLDVPGDFSASDWIHVGAFDRPNQKRGISPVSHVANNLADLADIQGSEVQATKINSGLGIVFKDVASEAAQADTSRGWADGEDAPADVDGVSPEDVERYERELAAAENQALKETADKLRAGQAAVVKLSANKTLESFKTERPNLNVIEMYDRLTDASGTVLGLTPMYTRLRVQGSYSGARTEMVLTRPVFAMWQKHIERNFLDWLAVRVLDAYGFNVSDGLEERLLWSWPIREEVDAGAYQSALQKKFLNGEINLIDLHGANTESFLDRRAYEEKLCADRGITPPWKVTVSGAIITDDNPATEVSVEQKEDNE